MREVNFLQQYHAQTQRDYIARALDNKPDCCEVAMRFGQDYWDGDRRYGYGGYSYNGKWKPIAEKMIEKYKLTKKSYILDIGCGKGHLVYDLFKLLYQNNAEYDLQEFYSGEIRIAGIEPSFHAREKMNLPSRDIINHPIISAGIAQNLGMISDHVMDFTISINVLHNLPYKSLKAAIREMVRITNPEGDSYICVESFRNVAEKCNLLNWQLTMESMHSPDDWKSILHDNGYRGDLEFIFFN